jgi:hypothetical protein
MKLTTEQIAKIEETLVLNGVVFEDIKLELIDHIASEIENNIGENNILFEAAFYQTFENWKQQLSPRSSLWIGTNDVAPQIVIDKIILSSKKLFIRALFFVLITTIVLTALVRNLNNELALENIRNLLRVVFILELLFVVVCKFLIWKSKSITSYGLIYKKLNIFSLGVLLIFFGIGLIPLIPTKADLGINLFSNFFASIYFILPIYYIKIAFNHFQFERKLSKV